MTNRRKRLGRHASMIPAVGAVFLAGATATAAAQSHGGAGGTMGGWGAGSGWLVWPLLLLVLLALAVFWAGSRGRATTARTEESDRALQALRERYARGELSDDEFERRRQKLQTQG